MDKTLLETTLSTALDNLVWDGKSFKYTGDKPLLDNYVSGAYARLDESVARLRLDCEVPQLTDENTDPKAVAFRVFSEDLVDLIENGDAGNSEDVFLKAINGEKVRGKRAVDVNIFEFTWLEEFKPSKQTIEVTAYLLMYVRYE